MRCALFGLLLLQCAVSAPVLANGELNELQCNCAPVETLPPIQIPDAERYVPPDMPVVAGEPPKKADFHLLKAADWSAVDGFAEDDLTEAWAAWEQSCNVLRKKALWREACEAADKLENPSSARIRGYFERYLTPFQLTNEDGSDTGLVTGYYEPLLKGSRKRTDYYRYPLYSRPDDMVAVNLSEIYPELAHRRLRGRMVDNRLEPYYSRGEIELRRSPLAGHEFLWVDDIVDLFFLQIQGSGVVLLENGETVHVGYADQNGHRYESIGRVLINQGELKPHEASMQGIKTWARNNPDKLRDLLNHNPSYVFFRELPAGLSGPLGALGVPLKAERSIAVDTRYVPLGAPVFLSTTRPNSEIPLKRLMMAQDTGGAIKGGVRADFFWGSGFAAGREAGAMKQQGRMWVFMPKGFRMDAEE